MAKQVRRSIHEDPPGRLDSTTPAERQQVHEVHDGRLLKDHEEELQNRWEAIMALRDIVMKQRMTILSLKADRHDVVGSTFPPEEMQQETTSKNSTPQKECSNDLESIEGATLDASPVLSFPSLHRREYDDAVSAITCDEEEQSVDSSDSFEMEKQKRGVLECAKEQTSPYNVAASFESPKASTDEPHRDIKDIIESIEQQASHVDAVIALEQLHITTRELQFVTNKLRERSAQVGELQKHVKDLQSQIATLELERDLHIAEARRARDDLRECIQYMVNIRSDDCDDETRMVSAVTASTSDVGTAQTRELDSFATPEKPSSIAVSTRPQRCHSRKTDDRDQSTPSTHVTGASQQSVLILGDRSLSSFSSDGHVRRRCSEKRNLTLCFRSQRGKESMDSGPAFERMTDDSPPRRARLFRMRHKNKKQDKRMLRSDRKDGRAEPSDQAKAARLKLSLAATNREAGELRTRLYSVTRYYDTIVASLHQNASSNRAVNTEFEADMTNQLSFLDVEKRTVMAELRRKEALGAKMQKDLSQMLRSECRDIPVQERASFTKR